MSDNITRLLEELRSEQKTFTGRLKNDLGEIHKRIDSIEADAARKAADGGGGFVRDASFSGGYGGNNAVRGLCAELTKGLGDLERHGRLRFETKTLLSAGITTPAAAPTIGHSGRFSYGGVRAALRTVPVSAASIFRVREDSHAFEASPQVEGNTKAESTVTLTAETLDVRTIATWLDVSRQALSDAEGLAEFLNASLVWALEKRVETELLFGAGVGQNLMGLSTIGTAFDASILSAAAGWNRADVLAAAGVQLAESGFNATHFVVSPRDWFLLETMKDEEGRYILGMPRDAFKTALWAREVIPSAAMPSGSFVAFDASQSVIRQRQMATVDVSFEHKENFTKNLATIRVEERLALVTMHGASVIVGSLSTSPA